MERYIKNVSKQYGKNTWGLRDFSLRLTPGMPGTAGIAFHPHHFIRGSGRPQHCAHQQGPPAQRRLDWHVVDAYTLVLHLAYMVLCRARQCPARPANGRRANPGII